jgi:DNA (cytosine-5)-methyltransferase 1
MKLDEIRVFEAFAGFGGASFGLKKAGVRSRIVMYSEWDEHARELFEANHDYQIPLFADNPPNQAIIKGDMTYGDYSAIPEFDLFTGGFPCQPFSTAGLGKGELDPRGTLFYSIIKVVKSFSNELKPNHILLENVKGMTYRKHQPTFNKILGMLADEGYAVDYRVLNSKNFGIPQNRERLWIFAEKQNLYSERLERNSGKSFFDLVVEKHLVLDSDRSPLHNFLDPYFDIIVSEDHFLKDYQVDWLIDNHKMPLHQFKETGHDRSLCLDIYNKKLRKDEISITLTEPHHNSLRVVERLGVHSNHVVTSGEKKRGYTVRKLTVLEHFRLMGFVDKKLELNQAGQSYNKLCKRAGNGWDINVVSKIFEEIYDGTNFISK